MNFNNIIIELRTEDFVNLLSSQIHINKAKNLWFNDHFKSMSVCGVWGVRAEF